MTQILNRVSSAKSDLQAHVSEHVHYLPVAIAQDGHGGVLLWLIDYNNIVNSVVGVNLNLHFKDVLSVLTEAGYTDSSSRYDVQNSGMLAQQAIAAAMPFIKDKCAMPLGMLLGFFNKYEEKCKQEQLEVEFLSKKYG